MTEAPVRHGVMSRREATEKAVRLFANLGLPDPETLRRALSAPGLGRAAAARHDRHGAVLQARTSDRVRRADHGARRHHADRRAGGDQEGDPRGGHGRPLHHPRSRRGRADRRPDHGAALRRDGRARRDRADPAPAAQDYTRASGQRPPGRAATRSQLLAEAPVLEVDRITASYTQSRDFLVLEDVSTAIAPWHHARRGRRIGLRQVDARAGDHRPPAAARGRDPVQGQVPRARAQGPLARRAARAADDLSDARRGAEPAPDGR